MGGGAGGSIRVISVIKGTVFFISQEKFIFLHFLEKIELVSKNAVFFFRRREKKKQPFENESVSAFQTFPGKKKNKIKKKNNFWKKKKQNENLKNGGKNGKLVP